MSSAARIGLVSDTHGLVRPSLARLLDGVGFIVHAGDVGGRAVLAALGGIAPVVAVYGNVDDVHDPALARERRLPVGALWLHVSHGHELGSPTPARAAAAAADADIVVFGHTHRAVVERVVQGDRRVLVVNPGAAGPRRFNLVPSVAILTVDGDRAEATIVECV